MSAPAGFRHQWWCVDGSAEAESDPDTCTCVPAWITYERLRCSGVVTPRGLPTDVIEGPPCVTCEGRAEHTEISGLRVPCAPGDGTRHPLCRGNGGGRMRPPEIVRSAS